LAIIERRAESFVEFHVTIAGTPDDWLVEIDDPASGQAIATVAGTIGHPALADTLDALAGAEGLRQYLVLIDGHAEPVEPQWVDPAKSPWPLDFVETNDGLLVYVYAGPDYNGPIEFWRTTDGREWQYVGDASTWPPTPRGVEQRNGVLLGVFWQGAHGTESVQTSSDGITWQPTSGLPPDLPLDPASYAVPTEGGWLLVLPGELWGSLDGEAWERIDIGEVFSAHQPQPPFVSGGGGQAVARDVLIWTSYADGGTRTTWILELT
jgi:hypothetical protein